MIPVQKTGIYLVDWNVSNYHVLLYLNQIFIDNQSSVLCALMILTPRLLQHYLANVLAYF